MPGPAAHAYELLAPIEFLQSCLDIPYAHHERLDGSGYPRGLAGEAIPYMARLFAIVDAFDAMTNARSYKPAWPLEEALATIEAGAGTSFDPAIAAVFVAMFRVGA